MGERYRDRWCPPLVITSNTTIIITESGVGLHVIALDTGTYYAHRDPDAYMQANYPGLYKAIEDKINAVIAGSVEVRAVPDPQNPGAGPVMLAFERTGGNALTLDLSNGGFTFTREWLGFDAGDVTDAVEVSGAIYGRMRPSGVWPSYKHAWRRHPVTHTRRQLFTADVWREDAGVVEHGSHSIRTWRYAQIPAGTIFAGYATRDDYARASLRLTGDDHGVFEEVFDAMIGVENILVIMDAIDPTGSDLIAISHPWELCRLMGDANSLKKLVSESSYSSDHHSINFKTVRLDSGNADAP